LSCWQGILQYNLEKEGSAMKSLEKARAKEPQPVWIQQAPGAVGRPNEADFGALKSALKAAVGPAAG
jgi:hypothetical protein